MDKPNAITPVDNNVIADVKKPEAEVAYATAAANALMTVINNKANKVMINGKQYLEFEDWQTVARFYKCTVMVESTKPLLAGGKFNGYEARAKVLDHTGRELSAAESSCTIQEPRWANRDRFQLKSMAQTRACAKALRNVFSWVVVLAGVATTPAEEMPNYDYEQPAPAPGTLVDSPATSRPASKPEVIDQRPLAGSVAADGTKATPKQILLINSTMKSKNKTEVDVLGAVETAKTSIDELTKSEASKAIDWLFAQGGGQ